MNRKILLGYNDPSHGPTGPFPIDLDIVLRSNLLLQANSGGGKSWTLRRMLEQSFKSVQQIVIDPEGEFSTLRSKFDFVLVAKGGDTPVAVASAPLLARRLLELGASAVVDLFEISKLDRPVWVAAFVEALVDAPKNLWHDLLIYVDEAHELAPEPGHGARESAGEVRSRRALIDLASKGRKRGFGVVAATQRLGKLSKDFAAELKNVLVGQTFIDIDRERAAACLGISKSGKAAFFQSARNMEPGTFFALGRALSLESTLIRVGSVGTEHPEAGRRQSAPPPPTKKISHLLPQLADLPKEAEEEGRTVDELRAKVRELTARLSSASSVRPVVAEKVREKVVEKLVVAPADVRRLERLAEKLEATEAAIDKQRRAVVSALGNMRAALETVVGREDSSSSSEAAAEGRNTVFNKFIARGDASPAIKVRKIKASSAYGKFAESESEPASWVLPTTLEREREHAEGRMRGTVLAPTEKYDAKGWTQMEEDLYQKFKARLVSELRQEAPALLRLVATVPELEVEVRREVVEVEGKTTVGRVARLLHEGWFDKFQTAINTSKQVNSTGDSVDRRTVLDAIDKLVSMGFLIKTTNGYKAVADMKVNVREAK